MTELSVAIIGSSGGGCATLGHTDPPALLQIIDRELRKIEGQITCRGVSRSLFVALQGGQGFDHVDETRDCASLYQISKSETINHHAPIHCAVIKAGTLKEVNTRCKELNKELAKAISKGEIHALICISISVELFSETLEAAAAAGIPVTGTGGTSLSLAASNFQIRLVGNAGGSVANTSLTRAVSYAHALASGWKADYRPWKIQSVDKHDESGGPSGRSILNACLPAFWGVSILKRILDDMSITPHSLSSNDENTFSETMSFLSYILEHHALPTVCAVITATSISSQGKDTSSLIMASVVASTVGWNSILCGLLAGYLVSVWQEKMVYWCIVQNVPATMTNMVATGGVGAAIAMTLSPLAPLLRSLTAFIRSALLQSVTSTVLPPGVVAFIWGCFCCYGSKVGWYHSVILPIILIEMECGAPSFLGAIDELTLVLVCAGVCSGNLVSNVLYPKKDNIVNEADLALCKRAVRINFLYGDFVEACYIFTERYALINAGCYIASGLSSYALVTYPDSALEPDQVPKTLAYLPLPASIWLAGSAWQSMVLASMIAFVGPFLCVIVNHSLLVASRPR